MQTHVMGPLSHTYTIERQTNNGEANARQVDAPQPLANRHSTNIADLVV